MEYIEIKGCNGCYGDFTVMDLCKDGFCMACEYQRDAELDQKTGGNDE
jgi:hypothetical protein